MKARLTAAVATAALAIPIAAVSAAPALAAPTRVLLTLQVTDRAGHRVAPTDAQVMAVATGTNIDLGSGLVPAGLNARNQAVAGSLTQVPLRIFDALGNPVTLPAVHAWASSNDGRTWRPVTVRLAGGRFLISVRNATSPGFTSLRALAGDQRGNSEQLTVIRAWAVR